MKKLTFLLVALFLGMSAMAHDFSAVYNGKTIYYNITSSTSPRTVAVTYQGTSYTSATYSGSVEIPAIVTYGGNSYSVTGITDRAFYGCSSLTSVIIPASVTLIEVEAFANCTGLQDVTVHWSLPMYIPTNVFQGVSISAVRLMIPSGRSSSYLSANVWKEFNIEELGAFEAIHNGKTIYYNITSNIAPRTVAVTFRGATSYEYVDEYTGDIEIPATVNYGGNTYSVTSIKEAAFYNCPSLKSVIIGNSVTSIGSSAFGDCTSLNSVIIGNSVKTIGTIAFNTCSSLKSITIPNSVVFIEEEVFMDCTSLSSVTIGNSVETIGSNTFARCTSLASVNVDIANPNYSSDNGVLFNKDKTNIILCPMAKTGAYIIPSSVTSIGRRTFFGCASLTSITIPSSVKTIGNEAFIGCTSLKSVTIPSSVMGIGNSTFHSCTSLESVTIPSSINAIGNSTFQSCTSLKSVNIPSSVTSIGSSAFMECTSLTSIDIPSSVTSIESNTFAGCTSLESINIPSLVTSIESYAFQGCTSLKSIDIPSSVSSISEAAFAYCTGLQEVTVHWTTPLTIIAYYVGIFEDVNTLSVRLIIPSGTSAAYSVADVWKNFKIEELITFSAENKGKTIYYRITSATTVAVTFRGKSLFEYADEYEGDIEIPETVTHDGKTYTVTGIGKDAFAACNKLNSVIIPNSVETIGGSAFANCFKLSSVTIGNSVKTIGSSCFMNCTSLISIDIPNSVETIGNSAFYECTSLASIDIPNSVETIEYNAFSYCSKLSSVTIGNSVKSIGNYAFSGCNLLTSIIIPNSVTSIGSWAFLNCTALKEVEVSWTTPLTVNANTFSDVITANVRLTVPEGTTALYKAADVWKNFNIQEKILFSAENKGKMIYYRITSATAPLTVEVTYRGKTYDEYADEYEGDIEIPETVEHEGETYTVTGIGKLAFSECKSLNSVIIPNSVKTIENEAFAFCSNLSSVTIGNSVKTIGDFAFAHCTSLASIDIPNSVETIEYGAFVHCSKLSSVTIGNSVKTIGSNAFQYCSDLSSVTIGNSVKTIGNYAFQHCTSLISIDIPNLVESIGNYAFANCTSLISIDIPNSVKSIGGSAFTGCTSLGSIIIPNSVTSIEDYAFRNCTGLKEVEVSWTTPLTVNANIFSGVTTTNVLLIVPVGTSELYKEANVWKNFKIEEKETVVPDISDATINITDKTHNSISISWTAATDNLTPQDQLRYAVSYNGEKSAYLTGITSYTIAGLLPDTEYSVGVKVIDLHNNESAYTPVLVKTNPVPVAATGVNLNKSATSIVVGNTEILTATVSPPDATNQSLTWSSSDEAVATVSDGLVTAISTGTATITVTTVDGGFTAACAVTVITPPATPIAVTGVSLNKSVTSIIIGDTETLIASITPDDATYKSLTWSSSNEAIATVNAAGIVTAITQGKATITVTTVDGGFTATCNVTIVETILSVTGVTLNKETATLVIGDTETLIATLNPEYAYNQAVTWSSSNEAVASVDASGLVTAIAKGTAIITVTTVDGGYTATCELTVTPIMFTVSFVANGGTEVASQIVEQGTILAPVATTRDGYDFVGWYTEETLTNVWNITTETVIRDMTLYAKWEIVVGILTVEKNDIKLYPNPTKGIVNIVVEGNPEVKVFSIGGKLVEIIQGTTVDLSAEPNGIYIFKVDGKEAKVIKH